MHEVQLLLEEFCDHANYIQGLSKTTIKRYRNVIGFFCSHAGIESIDQVTDDKVRELFLIGRVERNWAPNTSIVYHKTLAVFFRWCMKKGLIDHNPTDDIELPKLRKRLPAKLSKQEALRVLEVAYNYPYKYRFLRYRNHALFSTFVFAGLRKSEALNLKYADVDLDARTIFVSNGKGGKDRIIPMNHRLVQAYARYLTERRRLNKSCPEFFTSLNRNIGYTDAGLKRVVKQMRTASGIYFTIHKLRHTFATLMLEGGCDIYSLSKMLGHSNINTTTIYLAASAEHLRAQISKHPLNE